MRDGTGETEDGIALVVAILFSTMTVWRHSGRLGGCERASLGKAGCSGDGSADSVCSAATCIAQGIGRQGESSTWERG